MPKLFLIKRNKHYHPYSYRKGVEEEEDQIDSIVNQENRCREVGSPDSGFSQSPLPLTVRNSGSYGPLGRDDEHPVGALSPTRPDNIVLGNLSGLLPRAALESARCSNSAPPPSHAARSLDSVIAGVLGVKGAYNGVNVSLQRTNSDPVDYSQRHSSVNVCHLQKTEQIETDSSGAINLSVVTNNRTVKSDGSVSKPRSASKPSAVPRVSKAVRKIDFEIDTTSPVSGTIIRCDQDFDDEGIHVTGDIDASMNIVEVTPEARAELEKIENKIGDYICQLCKEKYDDAFKLAQHRCSRIVHIEYRCPECGKVFNCPANLASHRRWHKPRTNDGAKANSGSQQLRGNNQGSDGETAGERNTPSPPGDGHTQPQKMFHCPECGKKFRRQAFLQKHLASHRCGPKAGLGDGVGAKNSHLLKENQCKVCNSCFPNKVALELHKRCHTSQTFPCKYCHSTFYSSPGLTRHINKCHPTENKQVILLQVPVDPAY